MWNCPSEIKFSCLLLMVSAAVVLSGCAQSSRNVPRSGCCLDIPCVPCIFSIPLKTNEPDCETVRDTSLKPQPAVSSPSEEKG